MKWIRKSDYSDYTWTNAGLSRGTAYIKVEDLDAGQTPFDLKLKWDSGNDRRNFVIKTFAPEMVGLTSKDGSAPEAQCYTLEDGIGNWQIHENGMSSDCSKRTPSNWWDAEFHVPGGEPPANTTPASEPAAEEPVTEEPVAEEPAVPETSGVNACV